MVGATGFEPATSSSRTKRATKLRHAPIGQRRGGICLLPFPPSRLPRTLGRGRLGDRAGFSRSRRSVANSPWSWQRPSLRPSPRWPGGPSGWSASPVRFCWPVAGLEPPGPHRAGRVGPPGSQSPHRSLHGAPAASGRSGAGGLSPGGSGLRGRRGLRDRHAVGGGLPGRDAGEAPARDRPDRAVSRGPEGPEPDRRRRLPLRRRERLDRGGELPRSRSPPIRASSRPTGSAPWPIPSTGRS